MGSHFLLLPQGPCLALMLRRPFSSSVWMPLVLLDPRVAGPQDHRSCRSPKLSWDPLAKINGIIVVQLCLTLCDPMDCSMTGFPVLHISRSLLKLMSIESVMVSKHLILCHPLLFLPSIFPASGSFPMSRLCASGSQSIGVSASVLPMNIQG